jgi:hypothetical protein
VDEARPLGQQLQRLHQPRRRDLDGRLVNKSLPTITTAATVGLFECSHKAGRSRHGDLRQRQLHAGALSNGASPHAEARGPPSHSPWSSRRRWPPASQPRPSEPPGPAPAACSSPSDTPKTRRPTTRTRPRSRCRGRARPTLSSSAARWSARRSAARSRPASTPAQSGSTTRRPAPFRVRRQRRHPLVHRRRQGLRPVGLVRRPRRPEL